MPLINRFIIFFCQQFWHLESIIGKKLHKPCLISIQPLNAHDIHIYHLIHYFFCHVCLSYVRLFLLLSASHKNVRLLNPLSTKGVYNYIPPIEILMQFFCWWDKIFQLFAVFKLKPLTLPGEVSFLFYR